MEPGMNTTVTMEMVFYDSHNFQLFFNSWNVDTEGEYAAFLVGVIIATALLPLSVLLKEYISNSESLKLIFLILLIYVKTALVYLIMLAVMTYITGLFFAVTSGWVLGKLIVSWLSAFEIGTGSDGKSRPSEFGVLLRNVDFL